MSPATESITPIPSGRIIRLAASNSICTHKQLADLQFEPEQYFIGFDKDPARMEEHEEKLRSVGVISRFAVALLGKTKVELIEAVRSMDAGDDEQVRSGKFLEYVVDARGKLEALLSFVTALEIRHACAMANVYLDDEERLPPIPEPPAPEISRRHRRKLKI
jgi:hypothetical protein